MSGRKVCSSCKARQQGIDTLGRAVKPGLKLWGDGETGTYGEIYAGDEAREAILGVLRGEEERIPRIMGWENISGNALLTEPETEKGDWKGWESWSLPFCACLPLALAHSDGDAHSGNQMKPQGHFIKLQLFPNNLWAINQLTWSNKAFCAPSIWLWRKIIRKNE